MVSRRIRPHALDITLLAILVAGCGPAATPAASQLALAPIELESGGSEHTLADAFEPGTPFGWSVFIRNLARQPAVVDGYELLDKSPALEVVAAASLPNSWSAGVSIGALMYVTDELRAAVNGRPLVGGTIGSTTSVGWATGGSLVFLVKVPSAGVYSFSAVRLRYHTGMQSFETDLPASLEVCAGATVPPGSTCPFPSSTAAGS
jgi:hypothetical protein